MNPAPNRSVFIDRLRVAVTALVILHHGAIVYGGSGGWYWREEPDASNRLLLLFNAVNQSWFMGFFFLLAGYYTPAAFDRKGPVRFLADRFARLGLPLLAYVLVLSPLTIALARTTRGHPFWPGWWQMIREFRGEPGPLWFAGALLLFALAYTAWRRLWPGPAPAWSALPRPPLLFAAGVVIGLVSFLVRLGMPVGRNIAGLQPGYFPPYVLLFAAGCLAARNRLLDRVTFGDARPWLVVSFVLFLVLPVVIGLRMDRGSFSGGWTFNAAFYALWDPFMAWGIVLGLLWGSREYLGAGGALTAHLARHAYGAYIVHPPVLVGLSLLARGWPLPSLLKFAIVGLAACAGSFALATLLLFVPGLRRIL